MRKLLFAGLLLVKLTSVATIDRPDVLTFGGNGYYANGWYDYQVNQHSDGDGLLLKSGGPFVVSPRYEQSIRKVILSVCATQQEPTRYLRLCPYVDGVEVGTDAFDCAVRSVARADKYEFVTFDFDEASSVDAFRLCLDGSGNGNWRVAEICVVYGEKEDGEDAFLKQFARQLPTPTNLSVTSFSTSELHLAAEPVEDAVGYRFAVEKLKGTPWTERVENFVSAPGLSVDGWSLLSGAAKLDRYVGGTTPDAKAGDGLYALKIENAGKDGERVWVEVLTEVVSDPIREVSYMAKAGIKDKSDRVAVYGRRDAQDAEWTMIGDGWVPLNTASKQFVTNLVDEKLGFCQVKFCFEAEANNFTPCCLDSLRIAYGGNEEREPVAVKATYDEPKCDLSGLETARYVCRIQALGGSDYLDSSWSSLDLIDLSWSTIVVAAPEDVEVAAEGGKLTVSWKPVEQADHYLVSVVSADEPNLLVAKDLQVFGTTVTLPVPAVGVYSVAVTAVSPGGLSSATSCEVSCDVSLDQLGDVTAEAVDPKTIVAKWQTIPLAESYQAKLVRISGNTETLEYGWQTEDKKIVLPDGWLCHPEWQHNVGSSGSQQYPRLPFTRCWLATSDRGQPLTRLVCRYKCGSSSAKTVAATRLLVEVADRDGVWTRAAEVMASTSMTELPLTFEAKRDIRCVRLTCASASDATSGSVDIGRLALTYGEESAVEVESQTVTKGEATFGGLDPTARYRVVVAPQPSEGCTSASATVDLASERFRKTGAIPFSSLHGIYAETFDCLSNVVADTETRKTDLDWWQLFKGSGEVEKLLYAVGTNRTTGGVYAFGGNEGSPMLGTLATSSLGSSLGLAFRNDCGAPVSVTSLAFETIQRSLKGKPSTYVLEWLVTDGEVGIDAAGDWQPVAIPVSAPYLTEFPDGQADYRQSLSLTTADGLPSRQIPAGSVLLVRWRHEKLAAGPMMAIDNVTIEFKKISGLSVTVR